MTAPDPPLEDRPEFPFPATPETQRDFERMARLKARARRAHDLDAAECIELASRLSELFPKPPRPRRHDPPDPETNVL